MTITFLSRNLEFPHPGQAGPDGLLAVGGDLTPERLIAAYSRGIFPWYGPGSPILWWSPDPRLVLFPGSLHIPRSLRRVLNSGKFTITADQAFEKVIEYCAGIKRAGGHGTWLVPEMISAYIRLHHMGIAHSVEAWHRGQLAGGIYGLALGSIFFGESMFYRVPDASKTALVYLCRIMQNKGYLLMDCQQTTRHMLRFGAQEVSRAFFLEELGKGKNQTRDRTEKWDFSCNPSGFFIPENGRVGA
ncbi:leucyl/phenylalanyl-tRNA/protein transferase [Desulfonatronospira thiodismutans ASO3-1]|uniref:Leucyl/phenylalanyl-tRNA--protein transferase n=1 Tax=Desulfonatronospira thiodismutans ASO3-1 TaxID=555779 RepID=D6SSE4_9BACT|nr:MULTISPECIES: leucyl/phenylalanyl-tRNA--protein transferase [Desulfonatronospira]EFI33610.1 leucyl/phenylalanyl-tRNA/protein transferase [Desulfonatronospira thiodismutans ASO3-1]RQD75676.1 MAG: leucyl/phenylalanyl-tRNA--protein transferase [Desulfonatronospira sp. MSAO_Bac3]